jgi:dTDP-4-dehydrorhamnose 3,5-epimerase
MEIIKTSLEGAFIIKPDIFKDDRGWFMESYSNQKLPEELQRVVFVQDNHSLSKTKCVLRGLHCQKNPFSQTKLIRVTRGKVLDVIVDIRHGSPTYMKWTSVILSSKNKLQLWIPRGFLHGFVTQTNIVEFQYKVDNFYNHDYDRSIKYNDPCFGIKWGIKNPILSNKDSKAVDYEESDVRFDY